jgi:hypothetical protein
MKNSFVYLEEQEEAGGILRTQQPGVYSYSMLGTGFVEWEHS